jgi:hypothetical protein
LIPVLFLFLFVAVKLKCSVYCFYFDFFTLRHLGFLFVWQCIYASYMDLCLNLDW